MSSKRLIAIIAFVLCLLAQPLSSGVSPQGQTDTATSDPVETLTEQLRSTEAANYIWSQTVGVIKDADIG